MEQNEKIKQTTASQSDSNSQLISKLAVADFILEWNQSQPITLEKFKEHSELICLFAPLTICGDSSWLYYWMLDKKIEYLSDKNSLKCLLSRENIISLLSIIIDIVKKNDVHFAAKNLRETCLGYRKPYDINYYERLKFFYNEVVKAIKRSDRKIQQFLLIINFNPK